MLCVMARPFVNSQESGMPSLDQLTCEIILSVIVPSTGVCMLFIYLFNGACMFTMCPK
jgi:hypothetical protein